MKKVAIIDYGLGNLRSVYNSFEYIGAQPIISSDPAEMLNCAYAVLPGVGAFGDGMDNLNNNGWTEAIIKFAKDDKKPFLGICLGMQLLAKNGTENGDHDGLGLVDGNVVKLSPEDKSIRVPHIGWNDVSPKNNKKSYEGLEQPQDFYFVHSYILEPDDQSIVSGTCDYGQEFIASVEQDNIWGAQFHPEKSQKAGLSLLRNFLKVGD